LLGTDLLLLLLLLSHAAAGWTGLTGCMGGWALMGMPPATLAWPAARFSRISPFPDCPLARLACHVLSLLAFPVQH